MKKYFLLFLVVNSFAYSLDAKTVQPKSLGKVKAGEALKQETPYALNALKLGESSKALEPFFKLLKAHKGDLTKIKQDHQFLTIKKDLKELINIARSYAHMISFLETQLEVGRMIAQTGIKEIKEMKDLASLEPALVSFLEISCQLGDASLTLLKTLLHELDTNAKIKNLFAD